MIINFHTLTQFPVSALNRDFQGHLKTVPYGDASRTRISSAALKRSWREAKGPWAIVGTEQGQLLNAIRSRVVFHDLIGLPLVAKGLDPMKVALATLPWIHAICGQSETARKKASQIDPKNPLEALMRNEAVSLTEPEVKWIRERVEIAIEMGETDDEIQEISEADTKENRKNVKAIAENATIETVLTGRFTSGDAAGRTESSLSVAHSFTTHKHQATRDAMASIDTILTPKMGAAASMNERQIAAGTFYGYSCLSLPVMVSNLTGCAQGDWAENAGEDARELVKNLVLTIYNATPKTGKSTTASFGKPGFVMVEFGAHHQLNHAEAFENACGEATVKAAGLRMARYLKERDAFEGESGVTRLYAALDPHLEIPNATRVSVKELAELVAAAIPVTAKPARAANDDAPAEKTAKKRTKKKA
jgi:CRISPR system Cascade subunit CasC